MWCFYSGFSGSWDSPLIASRFCERDLCVFGCNRGRKSELGLVGSGSGNMNSSFLQIQGYPSNGAITTDRSKQNSSSQLLLLTSGPSSLSSAPLKDILISFEMWILLIVCHELPEENGGSDILVKEQKVIWVVGDWEKGNVRGKLGLLKANFIFLLISPVAGIAWATSSSFFFFFSRKVILMRVGATAGKCLAQSLMLPPPHTLAQTPFDWLTGTGAPDPSWCSVLCSLCQSKLTSEMKPAPYACSKLCCGFFIVTCLLGILLYCCDFHSTWRFRGQFGVDSQNTL